MLFLFLGHGIGHNHSHAPKGITRASNRLSHMVSVSATDDNENDETFQPTPSNLSNSHNSTNIAKNSSQMNMRGVFLHFFADACGSVIVIISALVSISCNLNIKIVYSLYNCITSFLILIYMACKLLLNLKNNLLLQYFKITILLLTFWLYFVYEKVERENCLKE